MIRITNMKNMKRKTLFTAALVALALGAQAQVIESYQVRDAVTLREPVLTDSINTEGRKYDTRNLLGTAVGPSKHCITAYRL